MSHFVNLVRGFIIRLVFVFSDSSLDFQVEFITPMSIRVDALLVECCDGMPSVEGEMTRRPSRV